MYKRSLDLQNKKKKTKKKKKKGKKRKDMVCAKIAKQIIVVT